MKKLYHYPRASGGHSTGKSYCGSDGPRDAVFANCRECFAVAAAERQGLLMASMKGVGP